LQCIFHFEFTRKLFALATYAKPIYLSISFQPFGSRLMDCHAIAEPCSRSTRQFPWDHSWETNYLSLQFLVSQFVNYFLEHSASSCDFVDHDLAGDGAHLLAKACQNYSYDCTRLYLLVHFMGACSVREPHSLDSSIFCYQVHLAKSWSKVAWLSGCTPTMAMVTTNQYCWLQSMDPSKFSDSNSTFHIYFNYS
jgi:hypothetical protein